MSHSRYGISHDELEALVAELGEPRYRADQVWSALYRPIPIEDETALPRSLRTRLAEALPLGLASVVEATSSDELTTKWLFAAGADSAQVETVLMRSADRASVCVSSQAGCAMGCTFCATGQAGLERHLDVGEIVEQAVRAALASPQRVTNVVFMGMGEPLANYDPVWAAVERIHGALGLSARKITISTVGVVPGMRRLAEEDLPVTLAVSLHAPNDELRSQLVPLNRRYPIADILDAAAEVAGSRGRRVTFEYACIAGTNDSPALGRSLGRLLRAWPGVGGAHVNLIPLNSTDEFGGRAASPRRIKDFAAELEAAGVRTTVRRNRGVDIDAACGQLRTRHLAPDPVARSTTMDE
ncbi:MAG: 23S rRNA (adenine(2503)-C(2))-methyltransferase RlmN [Acidimicrobiia bacterium]